MQNNNVRCITEVSDLAGKKVFLRTSLDARIENDEIINDFRLKRGLPTIKHLINAGAKVIVAGHNGHDTPNTLTPIYRELKKYFNVTFTYDIAGDETKECIDAMQNGDVVLLENLRMDPGEKKNDDDFAESLAALADLYVNDDFPTSHREHASFVGVPKHIPGYVGINFKHEYEELAKALKPASPSLFLIGGAKFDTKMPLVEKFLDLYDHIFVGGALANDFFKAKGIEVGTSLVSDIDLSDSPLLTNEKILLPVDVTVMNAAGVVRHAELSDIQPDENILDAGPKTTEMLASYIADAEMVLWNGPLGNYEQGFGEETEAVAKLIGKANGYSVIGGGDTVAAIEGLGISEQFNFLSTAGGAMLAFLEKGTLPGIQAIQNSSEA